MKKFIVEIREENGWFNIVGDYTYADDEKEAIDLFYDWYRDNIDTTMYDINDEMEKIKEKPIRAFEYVED